ncbi:MAG TPA: potassium-transporting ATPase subunit KdpC [Bryobacteraceae bacterium]|nr:potassium-transporting ATPase subunit KdpC [Bryobacteraceae bacterium]
MRNQMLPGLRINLFMTILFGIAYPLAVTGVGQMAFPRQANGSLIVLNRKAIGSEWIGQNFTKPEYFWPRPSAAGDDGYDPTASGASNLGPTNQKLIDRVKASIEKFRKENPDYSGLLPADLVTASASGLDPHLSPDSALAQAARVAKARGVSVDRISDLVAQFTEFPSLGLLGEPRVNVLKLNLALDERFPRP